MTPNLAGEPIPCLTSAHGKHLAISHANNGTAVCRYCSDLRQCRSQHFQTSHHHLRKMGDGSVVPRFRPQHRRRQATHHENSTAPCRCPGRKFTLGPVHEVTDRTFVVRRALRVNDSLPQESASPPHWQWQRGGWLLVDRVTSHTSAISLPDFDAFYSATRWYRDYVAYCASPKTARKFMRLWRKSTVASQFLRSSSMARISAKKTESGRPIPPAHPFLATKSCSGYLRARRRSQTNGSPSVATLWIW